VKKIGVKLVKIDGKLVEKRLKNCKTQMISTEL